ncbi:hypothetical protein KEJ37_00075 [Candidatus Bathyarchaeota archaeon]|nr:hypothetical protein [Candidatus Bathyarchaeota archaeon]
MLSEALGLELEGLSVLERKLLLELVHRYPHYWGKFTSRECDWQSQKEALEEFLQTHEAELVKEFAKAGLHGNGWKTVRRIGTRVKG